MNDALVSNGYTLDLEVGQPFPITFSIADITEPEKRKRDVSKKITLPGTSNNCNFFANAFGYHAIEDDISFDSTQKTSAIYYKRGVAIMPNALIKLDEAIVKDGVVSFTITLFSESVDIFLLLSTINVSELGWNEYDHTLSRANIKASWLTPSGSGYRYPLIERGNPRAGLTIWNTTDLIPYIHFKEVFEKMMGYVGITFTSDWLETDRVKNMLFGYGGGDSIVQSLNPIDINERTIDVNNGDLDIQSLAYINNISGFNTGLPDGIYQSGFQITGLIPGIFFTSSASQDLLSQFDNGEITIARSGNYRITLGGVITSNPTAIDPVGMTLDYIGFRNFFLRRNGTIVSSKNFTGGATDTDFNISHTFDFNLVAGDVVSFLYIEGQSQWIANGATSRQINISVTTSSPITIDMISIDTLVTDGSTVSLFKYIPEMKCSDFFKGAMRHFNLYMSNPDIDGVVSIEPLSEYYQPTNQYDDISELIDHRKPIKHLPTANDFAKNLIFQFKECKDFDFVEYLDRWNERYGDYNFEQGSYYAKGEKKFDLPWSTILPYEISEGILVPRYITLNGATVKANKGAPRLVMWNGLKDGDWVFRNTDIPSLQENLNAYPCIHHFDDWQDPDFDLNFKLVNELMYIATTATNLNCFSEYYEEFINEVTSPVGMKVDCYVKYNENDIADLDFSKFKMINGALFRLNLVKEFDNDFQGSTNIELIKVLKAKKGGRGSFTFNPVAEATSPFEPPIIDDTGVDVPFEPSPPDVVLINSPIKKNK